MRLPQTCRRECAPLRGDSLTNIRLSRGLVSARRPAARSANAAAVSRQSGCRPAATEDGPPALRDALCRKCRRPSVCSPSCFADGAASTSPRVREHCDGKNPIRRSLSDATISSTPPRESRRGLKRCSATQYDDRGTRPDGSASAWSCWCPRGFARRLWGQLQVRQTRWRRATSTAWSARDGEVWGQEKERLFLIPYVNGCGAQLPPSARERALDRESCLNNGVHPAPAAPNGR